MTHSGKNYKPGQFVSIGGKLAKVKVKKGNTFLGVCSQCANENNINCFCCLQLVECYVKLGFNMYPKFIKTLSVSGESERK